MAKKRQRLQNPSTGERIVFQQTEKDTDGTLVEFDHFMPPSKASSFPEHVQLNQEEQFDIVSGTARYRLNGVEYQAHAGENVKIPPVHIISIAGMQDLTNCIYATAFARVGRRLFL